MVREARTGGKRARGCPPCGAHNQSRLRGRGASRRAGPNGRRVEPRAMSAPLAGRAAAGDAMARWSAKALLITAGVFLVGGAIWYARAATVPLIVAALISTQLVPLIAWATGRGVKRGLAIAGCLLAVILISAGLPWLFTDALFGNLGGVGDDISAGVDKVIAWLRDNDDWVAQNEDQVREFLKGILPAAKHAAGGVLTGVLGTLSLAAQLISGALLMFVFLLY